MNRVVVADDNAAMTLALSILLRRWGWDVVVAYDGHAAIEAIRNNRPAVALVDIGLPLLDGVQVARCVRADRFTGRLVAISGFGGPQERDRSRRAGFDAHLVKPISPDELRGAVGVVWSSHPLPESSG